jgi:hypothetical protein
MAGGGATRQNSKAGKQKPEKAQRTQHKRQFAHEYNIVHPADTEKVRDVHAQE